MIRTAWSGTSGGPGVTQVFFQDANSFGEISSSQAQSAVNAMRAFWGAIALYIPDNITLTVSPVVDSYNVVSGDLEASVSAATAPPTIAGVNTTGFAMASGFKVNLNTTTIRRGRRVRGGIFVVPSGGNAFSTDGQVISTARTAINTAGQQFLSALSTAGLRLVVFSRPLSAGQVGGPRSGDVAPVTVMETNEKTAVLRGRRD
jgi:hypothetical protein